ncbi:glycosyltransferase family 4 protein [Thalassotalea mangrovi]|uniref:Glycosyltransferase family 4 protein n=1 Tax=Thalassotalea mangrovi TaxID=2572245 RepID=A0A4V5NWA6_9GAMM|nr:glycosyltransferase family 4 protein [Thalassotalea mangrovi]TKB46136.1 glycosyltransferase family 4 protein [Thalassotalea mangrovi]
MNIAIITDDSLPKSTLVHAKMLHELAVELKANGHSPVIIAPGTKPQKSSLDKVDFENIEYWKFKSGKLKGEGKVKRAIRESLLSIRAWKAIKPSIQNFHFDLIIYYSPSIFFGALVNKLKRYCNARSYLILRDIFPQWVIDEGLIKEGSLIERYFRYFERINYSAADKIGLMSPKNKEFFDFKTNNSLNTEVLFNWIDLKGNSPSASGLREKLGLQDKVIYFYGGNIGRAQDMSNLLRLAKAMKPYSDAHFIFLGQGDEVELVRVKINDWQLTNTSLLPSVTQEEYKAILQEVDVGMFSLSATHKSHNFPGKLLGYMHASLPILGSVNPGNDVIDIITGSGAGYIYENGQDEKLLKAAIDLYDGVLSREQKGNNGNRLLAQYFSVETAVQKILSVHEEASNAVS